MVVTIIYSLVLLFSSYVFAEDIDTQIRLGNSQITEFSPLDIYVDVEKSINQPLQVNAIESKGKVYPLVYVDSEDIDNGMLRERQTYYARIPPQAIGTHTFESYLLINSDKVQLPMVIYQVKPLSEEDPFALVATINDGKPAYVGETIPIEVHYYFYYQADQLEAQLDHLKPTDFALVGSPRSELLEIQNNIYLQKIIQKVVPQTSGNYLIGPSYVGARSYKKDFFGKIIPTDKRVLVEAPETLYMVLPLPSGYDSSFNGLVGEYQWDIQLHNKGAVRPGEILDLELILTGSLEGQVVVPPDFSYIPEFMSSFLIADQSVEYEANAYRFLYKIRITDEDVTQIPSLYWTYFNPREKTYQRLVSNSIQLSLSSPSKYEIVDDVKDQSKIDNKQQNLGVLKEFQLGSSQWTLKYIDIWILLLFYTLLYLLFLYLLPQIFLLRQKWKPKSMRYYDKAQVYRNNWGYYRPLMEKAILQRCLEKAYINEPLDYFNDLPEKVQNFKVFEVLEQLDFSLYAKGHVDEDIKKWRKILETLFFSL